MRRTKRAGAVLVGGLVAAVLVVVPGTPPAGAAAVAFTVTSLADTTDVVPGDGVCATAASTCTLRAAITEANANTANTYAIGFTVAGTIQLGSQLPIVDASVTLDGASAPGFSVAGGPVITIRGLEESQGFGCLVVSGPSPTVRSLRLAKCTYGVRLLSGAVHARIVGNQIGNDGVAFAASNAVAVGVASAADDTLVGGTTAADRNVISGFLVKGVLLQPTATGAVVEGNHIGTDRAGTAAIRNPAGTAIIDFENLQDTSNVAVESSSPSALVQGNVISGNAGWGISVFQPQANLTIKGNLIGADATGTATLGNFGFGIQVQGQAHATIGGTGAGEGNVIVDMRTAGMPYGFGYGIDVNGSTATILGNRIGTNAAGTAALKVPANPYSMAMGIHVGPNTLGGPQVGSHVTIGGTAAGAGNTIASALNGLKFDGSDTNALLSDVSLQGNRIGTNTAGTAALGIGSFGMTINPRVQATVGGAAAGAGNVISGNGQGGANVNDNRAGISFLGNRIGTDLAGSVALPNGTGIQVASQVAGKGDAGVGPLTIGGGAAGAGNLISGNTQSGIAAGGDVVIKGNRIGTNAAGTAAVPNSTKTTNYPAVDLGQGTIVVGGSAPGEGNQISGNRYSALRIGFAPGLKVQGNLVGTGASGSGALPNGTGSGISSRATGDVFVFGATSSGLVGGVAAGEGNTFAFGERAGITNWGVDVAIRGNRIFAKTGLSIDLLQHHPESPGNHDQIDPTLTNVTQGASSTSISGTVTSDRVGPVLVDVYASDACQAAWGSGEAKQLLGTISVPYAGGGVTTAFSGSVATSTVGSVVTATATVAGNGTSQFSACQPISDLQVTVQDNATAAPLGSDVGSLFTVRNNGPTAVSGLVAVVSDAREISANADQVWADAPSQGSVSLEAGTWTIGSLASGATATVCLRGDLVRSTSTYVDPILGPLQLPASFEPTIDTEGSLPRDPYRGNDAAQSFIQVGPYVAGAAVCPLPPLAVADAQVVRPSTGTTPMTFTVTVPAQTRPVTVHWATQNGTAVAVEDYLAASGDLTFAPGQTSKAVLVQVVGNQSDEPDKSFSLNLTAPKHARLGDGTAVGTVKANHVLAGCPPGSTSNQRYVCHLYFDSLGRASEPGGFTYWVDKLNKGTPRSTMAKSYLGQPEALRKVADRAYVLYLGRHGTDAELTGWAKQLAARTVSTQAIRISVLASAEYFTHTGGTNTLYVQRMFQDVFRRPVDQSGLTYWTGQLAAGKTRTNVATRFMAEPEGRRAIVGDIYLRFLRRTPTLAEANGWVGQLAAGKTEVDIGIGLVASTEYFNRPAT